MNQGPTEAGGRCHIVLMKVIAALPAIVALLAMPASGSAQAVPIRYRTADLACARFHLIDCRDERTYRFYFTLVLSAKNLGQNGIYTHNSPLDNSLMISSRVREK